MIFFAGHAFFNIRRKVGKNRNPDMFSSYEFCTQKIRKKTSRNFFRARDISTSKEGDQ